WRSWLTPAESRITPPNGSCPWPRKSWPACPRSSGPLQLWIPEPMERPPVVCQPIGHVENQWGQSAPPEAIRATPSRLVIDPEFVEGLDGFEPGQRLTVVFH